MRLQIVLMGWEYDRLVEGLRRHPSDKVIFVISSNRNKWKKKATHLADRIAKQIPLVKKEYLFLDFFNVEEALFGIIKIIEQHSPCDEIVINISGGAKPIIIAAVLAAQFYPVKIFYVIPQRYNLKEGEFISSGAAGTINIPTFALNKIIIPSKPQKELLQLLTTHKISLNRLVERYVGRAVNYRDASKYKSRFLYLLKQLKVKGLVSTEIGKNRELYIWPTETGRFLLKIIK